MTKVLDFNRDHPERKEDEFFVGNFSDIRSRENISPESVGKVGRMWFKKETNFEESRWKKKRKGTVAYDNKGGVVVGFHPVFIKRSEVAEQNPEVFKKMSL